MGGKEDGIGGLEETIQCRIEAVVGEAVNAKDASGRG